MTTRMFTVTSWEGGTGSILSGLTSLSGQTNGVGVGVLVGGKGVFVMVEVTVGGSVPVFGSEAVWNDVA